MSKFSRLSHLALMLAAAFVLAACSGPSNQDQHSQQPEKAAAANKSPAVATINGTAITRKELRAYLRRRAGGQEPGISDQDRQNLLKQLISIELLAQHARQQGLDQSPDLLADLQVEKAGLLANAFIRQRLNQHPIGDKQLKAAYQARVEKMGQTEYKARHILLPDEGKAKAAIAKLEKGADFATVAKQESTGPSAKKGGELGWFNPSQMVPAFTQAVKQLKKGQYTHTPVKTRFGWHVIFLEDTRATPKPSFASLKDQLKQTVQRQQVEDLVNGLRAKAKVKIDQAALKKMPATSSATAPNSGPQNQSAPPSGSSSTGSKGS